MKRCYKVLMSSAIQHLLLSEETDLQSFARTRLKLSPGQLKFYLSLGCFYLNRQRLQNVSAPLHAGDYLRFHPRPRRFSTHQLQWPERMVKETDDFLIVNKPAGLPTHASLDNLQENLLYQLQRALGRPLHITHRLDVNTSGLLVLGKSAEAASLMNSWLENGKIRKIYEAQIHRTEKVEPGECTDFMRPQRNCPKDMSEINPGNWLECRLKILSVQEHQKHAFWQRLRISLVTGRTHQIRAQLAHRFAPILGDQLYGSRHRYDGTATSQALGRQNSEPIALQCVEIHLPDGTHCRLKSSDDKFS